MRLIVDLSNLYWRNRKLDHLKTSDGKSSGALYGTMRSLGALAKRFKPEEFYIVEDGSGHVRRNMDPEYKGDRIPREMWKDGHEEALKAWVTAHGAVWIHNPDREADDVIAMLAREYEGVGRVVIVSKDHDFKQLLSDDVSLLAGNASDKVTIAQDLEDELGIRADQYLECMAIAGDDSDHVSGIPGVGEKTAAKWLQLHGDLEGVLRNEPSARLHADRIRRNMEVLGFLDCERTDCEFIYSEQPDKAARREGARLVALAWEMPSMVKPIEEQGDEWKGYVGW